METIRTIDEFFSAAAKAGLMIENVFGLKAARVTDGEVFLGGDAQPTLILAPHGAIAAVSAGKRGDATQYRKLTIKQAAARLLK